VHNGYHYPRSFTTAYRSRFNFPRFLKDWPRATHSDFTAVYAISRISSKVSARQFVRFCTSIGASLDSAPTRIAGLFDSRTVEGAFIVQEPAFDAVALRDELAQMLRRDGVEVFLGARATTIGRSGADLAISVDGPGGGLDASAPWVFNCTYSALNWFAGTAGGIQTPIKHEATELALVRAPVELQGLSITVMDGPFFSLFPYPSLGMHTLSHVRYTPHAHWPDQAGSDPYAMLASRAGATRFERMRRDAMRFVPAMEGLEYADSLFEVKSVLARNEVDDGRPILLECHPELPGLVSILGGKIDNIYDVLDSLDDLDIGARAGADRARAVTATEA
jgi:glycine/D-amino acid oxidase-like deaminating enzyme